MILVRITALMLFLFFLTFLISQVVIPILRGTVLLPMFRARKEAALEGDLAEAHQRKVEERQVLDLQNLAMKEPAPPEQKQKPTTTRRRK